MRRRVKMSPRARSAACRSSVGHGSHSARHDHSRQFIEYPGTSVFDYIINLARLRQCFDVLNFDEALATAMVMPASAVVAFLLLNCRVFRKSGAV
jgi:hypothetical protein